MSVRDLLCGAAGMTVGGVKKWWAEFSTTGAVLSTGIAVDSQGSSYIVGWINATVIYGYILKIDSYGNLIWSKRVDNAAGNLDTQINAVCVDPYDNIYVVGGYSNIANPSRGFILKISPSGDPIWGKKYQDNVAGSICSFVEVTAVTTDSTGKVYVTGQGYSALSGGELGIITSKLDSNGNPVWTSSLAGTGVEFSRRISVSSSGDVFVSGEQFSKISTTAGTSFIAKYSSSGSLQWQRYVYRSTATNNYGAGVGVDSSGNSYFSNWALGLESIDIAKMDTNGNFQWHKRITTSVGSYLTQHDMIVDQVNDIIYFDGMIWYSTLKYTFFALMDTSGNLVSAKKVQAIRSGTTSTDSKNTQGSQELAKFSIDAQGNIYYHLEYSNLTPRQGLATKLPIVDSSTNPQFSTGTVVNYTDIPISDFTLANITTGRGTLTLTPTDSLSYTTTDVMMSIQDINMSPVIATSNL